MTDEEALAFAAALTASFESSFASFQALMRTGRLGCCLFPPSDGWMASGSTVEGIRPGSKCGAISSCNIGNFNNRKWQSARPWRFRAVKVRSYKFYLAVNKDPGRGAPSAFVLQAHTQRASTNASCRWTHRWGRKALGVLVHGCTRWFTLVSHRHNVLVCGDTLYKWNISATERLQIFEKERTGNSEGLKPF